MSLLDDYEELSTQLDISVYKKSLDEFMVPMLSQISKEIRDIYERTVSLEMKLDELQDDFRSNISSVSSLVDYKTLDFENRINTLQVDINDLKDRCESLNM